MNVTINRYYWLGARGNTIMLSRDPDGWRRGFAECSQRQDRKWGCANTAGHRQLALRVTAKMTWAALPARVAHAKQYPYLPWTSKTTASSNTAICHYFCETHHRWCLQRLIMPNFSSLLGVQKYTLTLAFVLLSPTLPHFQKCHS